GEDARERDHDHDHAGDLGGVGEDVGDVADPDGAVDHHAHEQPVDDGDDGSLGRGEPAGAHAAQDDHWRDQAPGCVAQRGPEGWRASAPSFLPKPWRRESHTAGMIRVRPVSRPGITPAAKSAGTEAPGTSTEYTMKASDGGMMMPVAAAAPMTLAENGAG